MEYVCDAPEGKTWFRFVTEGEAAAESRDMGHAVEKYFRRERETAAESFKPASTVFFEQAIGLEAHIKREMPLFLTLRDTEGAALVTAMLPPRGRPDKSFSIIIVGPAMPIPIQTRGKRSRLWPIISASRSTARNVTRIVGKPINRELPYRLLAQTAKASKHPSTGVTLKIT
jgi:hypothetical protein